MANNRQAIRTAVMTLLMGNTSADQNVYANRETKLWTSELPAVLIHTSHEPVVPEGMSGRRYARTLQLVIKIRVQATQTVDDDLDSLAGEVETIIDANPGLGGTVQATIQTGTEIIVDSGGEEDIATATLTFECKYIS